MEKYFEIAKHNPLWNGIGRGDFTHLCKCLGATARGFERGDVVMLAGGLASSIGLLISGRVKIIKEASDGNATILAEFSSPELFGETFACAGITHSPVTVLAADNCEILFFNYKKIIDSCPSACGFHRRLIENMLKLIADKNLLLNQKIEILSKRTTRDKLLAFFDIYREGADKFEIPYNREELAHFLCVDRSAMSGELCKMRDDGLIRFKKNAFELL